MSRGICKKCHRKKARKVLGRHQKGCVSSPKDIEHYSRSKGSLDADYKKKQHPDKKTKEEKA